MEVLKNHVIWKGKKFNLLTETSAMSCWSWSLPALKTCPFAVTEGENAICGGCYATQGRYGMPNVLTSQFMRMYWTKHLMRENRQMFIDILTETIDRNVNNDYFRVHDSGDLFSERYTEAWIEIVNNLPGIKFWFPTRNWGDKVPDTWKQTLVKLNRCSNVVIRPSALYLNDEPPRISGLSHGTTVSDPDHNFNNEVSICPKSLHGGSCQDNQCRLCWDNPHFEVSYISHGRLGKKELTKTPEKTKILRKQIQLTVKGQLHV